MTGTTPELDLLEVHASHADFVWKTLQRMGVRGADLDDALQEVFLVVHRKLHTFDGSSQVSTWLFTVCQRVAVAQRRRAYRWRERPSEHLDREPGGDLNAELDAAISANEDRRQLEEILESLSPDKRAVFVMFEIEGITCPEIASMLGVPTGTVYSRLSAARSDFKRAAERLKRRRDRGGMP